MALWHPFKLKKFGKGREREKIKIIVPFRSVPFLPDAKQKIPKKLKRLKNTIMALFQAKNRLEKVEKEIK